MINNLENEVWKPITGYEGLYEVSNYSRIKSTKFKLHRILNPNTKVTESSRYLKCRLSNHKGEMEIIRQHRVAAMHFVPNPNPAIYTEVNHKDGDRNNNHVSNFEWTTHRENTLHGKLATNENKSSKYKGISYVKANNNYTWAVYMNGKHHRRYGFKTEEEAYEDYKRFHQEKGLSLRYL